MIDRQGPVAVKAEGKRCFESSDFAGAEAIFRHGHETWPNRLDLAVWLARSLEQQGELVARRKLLDPIVTDLDASAMPQWAPRALADQGYLLHRGVWLCLNHAVISDWMRQRMLRGGYEEVEADLLEATVESGDRILEVGGGMGFMAAFAARCAADVTSVVYEANPGLVPVADHTMALNRVDFDFRNAMLGAAAGTAPFHVHAAFWASSANQPSADSTSIDVAVHDVNDVLGEQDFTMVVMDIEGGEIDLLPMMDLDSVTRIVVETHPEVSGRRRVSGMLKLLRRRYGFTSSAERENVHLLVRSG